jgi:response regulator RpfG family c-di-GMP phosphodiesterase
MHDESLYRLLIVDDEPNILTALSRLFDELPATQVYTAENVTAAIAILAKHRIDVLISDEKMPRIEGHKLVEWMKDRYPDTLRIILTGYADTEAMRLAVNRGDVYRYLFKPWDDDELLVIVRNALEHARTSREREEMVAELAELVDRRTAELHEALAKLEEKQQSTEESLNNTFAFLDSIIAMINRETGGRTISRRVSQLAKRLAEDRGAGTSEIRLCEMASYFFPLGALSLGVSIEEALDQEGEISYQFLETGQHLLGSTLNLPELAHGIRHLREHWDGTGTPDGLSGSDIPLVSRTVRLAFDYIFRTDVREQDHTAVRRTLSSQSGTIYDPTLVARLFDLLSQDDHGAVREVPAGRLVPGMVLAHDLKLDNGMTYITAGTTITREMISSILNRIETKLFPLTEDSPAQVFRENPR